MDPESEYEELEIPDVASLVLAVGDKGFLSDEERLFAAGLLKVLTSKKYEYSIEEIYSLCEAIYREKDNPGMISYFDQIRAHNRDNPPRIKYTNGS